jgi:hypothetical protein
MQTAHSQQAAQAQAAKTAQMQSAHSQQAAQAQAAKTAQMQSAHSQQAAQALAAKTGEQERASQKSMAPFSQAALQGQRSSQTLATMRAHQLPGGQQMNFAHAPANLAIAHMSPEQRAHTISGMNGPERTAAMYAMSPQQRAEAMVHMSPELRNQFMGGSGSGSRNANSMRNVKVEHAVLMPPSQPAPSGRSVMSAVAVGAVPAALFANSMMHGNRNQAMRPGTNRFENSGARTTPGTAYNSTLNRSIIPGPPAYANPRRVGRPAPGAAMPVSAHLDRPINWAPGTGNIPRSGDARNGLPGALDPGGYIRSGAARSSVINPNYALQQFQATIPNYQEIATQNNRHLVRNRSDWPWSLPQYSPGWFNNNQQQYPWNWPQQNGLNNGDWNNGGGGWNQGGGFLGTLARLFSPQGVNPNLGWIPNLNYYNRYDWDNQTYPCDYFSLNGFCPTPAVFNVSTGQIWQPGVGYFDNLPDGYNAPITVAVQESVPTYDQSGQIVGYQIENFYYNAFWDPNAQAYGYYDYQQQFHWVTFPWLNSWSAETSYNPQSY